MITQHLNLLLGWWPEELKFIRNYHWQRIFLVAYRELNEIEIKWSQIRRRNFGFKKRIIIAIFIARLWKTWCRHSFTGNCETLQTLHCPHFSTEFDEILKFIFLWALQNFPISDKIQNLINQNFSCFHHLSVLWKLLSTEIFCHHFLNRQPFLSSRWAFRTLEDCGSPPRKISRMWCCVRKFCPGWSRRWTETLHIGWLEIFSLATSFCATIFRNFMIRRFRCKSDWWLRSFCYHQRKDLWSFRNK